MRKAQQWVVCGEKPNHSSACPCRAKLLSTPKAESPSLWTEEEPGEFLYSTVPQVCNELLCVLTNGTYTSVVDFVHFSRSAELDMNMRMASLIVIDFGLNFYGTDTFKLQEQIVFREVQDRNTKQEDVEAPASPLMFRVQEIKQPTQCPHVPLETPPIPPKFRELISQLQCCGGLETHYNDIINCSQVSTSFLSPLPDILHKAVDESSWEAPNTDLEPAFSSHFSPRAQNYQTFQMVPDDSWTHSVLTIPQWSMEEACACYEIATPPAMLFSHTELSALHLALPLRCKDRTWTLMYSTRIHGTSYRTLLSNIQGVQNVLLVIQDEHNVKFGCLSTVGFEPKLSYRGTGETFVYTTNSLRDVEVFRWVHTNHHFIYVASTYFMVGGGGSCAIRVDQELIRGCTSACPTFHSPPLTKTAEFNILAVELWSLD